MDGDATGGEKIALKGRADTRPKGVWLDVAICVAAGFLMFVGAYFVDTFERSLSFGLVVFAATGAALLWSRIARSERSPRDVAVNIGLAALVMLVVIFLLYAVFNLVRSG